MIKKKCRKCIAKRQIPAPCPSELLSWCRRKTLLKTVLWVNNGGDTGFPFVRGRVAAPGAHSVVPLFRICLEAEGGSAAQESKLGSRF